MILKGPKLQLSLEKLHNELVKKWKMRGNLTFESLKDYNFREDEKNSQFLNLMIQLNTKSKKKRN